MVWCLSCHRSDARLFKRLCGYKDESVLYNKTILTSVRPTCQGHFPNDALSPPTILDCGKRRRPQTASRNRVFREDLAAAAAATAATMVALAQDTDYTLRATRYALHATRCTLRATLHYTTIQGMWREPRATTCVIPLTTGSIPDTPTPKISKLEYYSRLVKSEHVSSKLIRRRLKFNY